MPYYWNGAGYFQQEARLIELDDDRIFALFTARFTRRSPFTQIYGIMKFDRTTNTFAVESPKWINYGRDVHSKNFVPLLFDHKIYLIPSINPLVILRLDSDNIDETGVVTVVYEGNQTRLPWREEYGTHIRGGTAAIIVGDCYLSFFHTRVSGRAQGVDHYFMGALTLCPRPPFLLRSMSTFPIVINSSWYEGPWLNKVASYVVYPIGIDVDDQGHVVTVSIGHQDGDAFVVRMRLAALLKTLAFVNTYHPL